MAGHLDRHGPTSAHTGAYMARRNRAKLIGPTGIVGPREIKGGILGPLGDAKAYNAFPLYRRQFRYFLLCGTKLMSLFCRQRGNALSIQSNTKKGVR